MKYIATTNLEIFQATATSMIAMVDGTIPGWVAGYHDLHFDHHAPGGGKVQIDEMFEPGEISILERERNLNLQDVNFINTKLGGADTDWTIATTQLDADACVAAAWLQLTAAELTEDHRRKLRAIALDCDYLMVPPGEPEQDLAEFAAKAVAAMKASSQSLPAELGLNPDKKSWTEEEKIFHDSEAFRRGAEWLIAAVRGNRPYPGESGEADAYFSEMASDIDAIRQAGAVWLVDGAAVLDHRSFRKYIDPRCLAARAIELGASQPITLTVKDRPINLGSEDQPVWIPGYLYTLGSLAAHPAAAALDLTSIFPLLAAEEKERRGAIGQPPAFTTWGGRAAVGGSGWRDGSLLSPDDVIRITLAGISSGGQVPRSAG